MQRDSDCGKPRSFILCESMYERKRNIAVSTKHNCWHFYGVERVKRFVNVHLHCICLVSNLKWKNEMRTLPHQEEFLRNAHEYSHFMSQRSHSMHVTVLPWEESNNHSAQKASGVTSRPYIWWFRGPVPIDRRAGDHWCSPQTKTSDAKRKRQIPKRIRRRFPLRLSVKVREVRFINPLNQWFPTGMSFTVFKGAVS